MLVTEIFNTITLFEGRETQNGLSLIADAMIKAAAIKCSEILYKKFDLNGGDPFYLSADDIGAVIFSEAFTSSKSYKNLPSKIQSFIKDMISQYLRIAFTSYPRKSNWRGWYKSKTVGVQPEIFIVITKEKFAEVIRSIQQNPNQRVKILADFLNAGTYRETLVHELTHAYDDWISGGKYRQNARSVSNQKNNGENHEAYLNDPIEINARYTAAVATLDRKSDVSFLYSLNAYQWAFTRQMDGWKLLSSDDRKRILKRLATHWENVIQKQARGESKIIDTLISRLNRSMIKSSKISNGILIQDFGTKSPEIISKTLKLITFVADKYKFKIAIEPKIAPIVVRPFGFKNQRPRSVNGGLRDYSLPRGVSYIRSAN